jgi:hypothetical protein
MTHTAPDDGEHEDVRREPIRQLPNPEKNERLSYLLEVYKLYHGHINTMFNYFLILVGLIANGYIQSLQKSGSFGRGLPTAVATFGVIASVICFLIHIRSRDLIDITERGLAREEHLLFSDQGGFLIVTPRHRSPPFRHKYQFPAMYLIVAFAFLLMALYPATGYFQYNIPDSPP